MVPERGIGGFRRGDGFGLRIVHGDGFPFLPPPMVDEIVVGNPEQPGPERRQPEEGTGRDIGPNQDFRLAVCLVLDGAHNHPHDGDRKNNTDENNKETTPKAKK